jgi:predicted SAM-dependent methyltransferase
MHTAETIHFSLILHLYNFGMANFSFKRNITDYAKVQVFISNIIRGKRLFMNKKRFAGLEYLDIGCGPNMSKEFVNLDYLWMPGIDICWDLTKDKLPFEDNCFKGVFSEHCFEHIPFEDFQKNMKEIYRVMKPGGTFRLSMPDGEIYMDLYNRRKNGENIRLPYESEEYISPMHRINGIFRKYGHQFIYDFTTVEIILKDIGFKTITKETFNHGKDHMLLRDSEYRAIESLYVEAIK